MTTVDDTRPPRAFFGRTRGKKLRGGQEAVLENLLPALLYDPARPPDENFAAPFPAFHIEIGFGGGEHLVARAAAHPDTGFIGCEPFINGQAKLLAKIRDGGLNNIRIWNRDALELLPFLPTAAFARAYLLYLDPWPKRRHHKRRFLSDDNLTRLARILAPGADLCFATDIDDYAGWGLARVRRSADFTWQAERADDWRLPWPGWPGTRYEAKALREGRRPCYLTFRRL
ncbi:MAG: tRNA (guanine(46)-N(7))-methyltransferase TrmB [Methylobacteriaceae bacterium]|jgi:tRNA (guanine-N7-)-methyltransferase|nr:tRNA (guanine(46)-N(7))-methyltransferase TrmB [Methylobacteriaceae bacterium]